MQDILGIISQIMGRMPQQAQTAWGDAGVEQKLQEVFAKIQQMLSGLGQGGGFPGMGGGMGGGIGGNPAPQPGTMSQPMIDWRNARDTWRGQRPQRPEGGFVDPASRQAYQASMDAWRGQRPPLPDLGQGSPQGHAWGHSFRQTTGMSPGKDMDLFKAFKRTPQV